VRESDASEGVRRKRSLEMRKKKLNSGKKNSRPGGKKERSKSDPGDRARMQIKGFLRGQGGKPKSGKLQEWGVGGDYSL